MPSMELLLDLWALAAGVFFCWGAFRMSRTTKARNVWEFVKHEGE